MGGRCRHCQCFMNRWRKRWRMRQRTFPKLPTQRRCAAHTLNHAGRQQRLQWGDGNMEQAGRQAAVYQRAQPRPRASGTCKNRSSVVANQISGIGGKKSETPCPTSTVAPALEEDIKERLITEIVTSTHLTLLPSSQSQDMVTEKLRKPARPICLPG
ncbi:hypothetical protein GWK47_052131 [Chionoecetes opilio]|uniref:Uncharacterized protein n=1 Tax=Chionoecetes opilio TaxID=41210 RepID=A0A8J4YC31_CHIOP|nr:hypothetical protein GWK47_052131 [Chionoecetes opilio]